MSPKDNGCCTCWNPCLCHFFLWMPLILMMCAGVSQKWCMWMACSCCHPNNNAPVLKSSITSSGDRRECPPDFGNAQRQNSSGRLSTLRIPRGRCRKATSCGGRCQAWRHHEPLQMLSCKAWLHKASGTLHIPLFWFGCFRRHLDLRAANPHILCCHGEKAAHTPLLPHPPLI
jgi:hypothetical protein